MTAEERGEQLCQALTQALMGRSLLTGIAVPMITQAIKNAVDAAQDDERALFDEKYIAGIAAECEACAKLADRGQADFVAAAIRSRATIRSRK